MRAIAIIVILLGIASLVFGVIFMTQAADAKQEVADSIAPVTLDELDGKYDAAKAKAAALKAQEEPGIQAGTAMPSAMYNYLSAQRASLGLARANVGAAKAVMYNGILFIIVGAGLVLTGLALAKKSGD